MSPLKAIAFMPWPSSIFSSPEGLHDAPSYTTCSEYDLSMINFHSKEMWETDFQLHHASLTIKNLGFKYKAVVEIFQPASQSQPFTQKFIYFTQYYEKGTLPFTLQPLTIGILPSKRLRRYAYLQKRCNTELEKES